MTKIEAKYVGPDDPEFRNGEIYLVFPIKEIADGSMVAAENIYGEAYAMPANLFEPIEN